MKYFYLLFIFAFNAFCMMEDDEPDNKNFAFDVNYNLAKSYMAEVITRQGACDDIISKYTNMKNIFRSEYLKHSILDVIPKAMADCICRNSEFTGHVYRVVIFKASPNKCIYSRANWNSVILYNYLKFCRYQKDLQDFDMKGFDKQNISVRNVAEYVLSRYKLKYKLSKKDIEMYHTSISDIEEYDRALGVSAIITRLPSVKDILYGIKQTSLNNFSDEYIVNKYDDYKISIKCPIMHEISYDDSIFYNSDKAYASVEVFFMLDNKNVNKSMKFTLSSKVINDALKLKKNIMNYILMLGFNSLDMICYWCYFDEMLRIFCCNSKMTLANFSGGGGQP